MDPLPSGDGLCRMAFKKPRRVIGSALFPEDADLGTCGRADAGCDDDDEDDDAGGAGVQGACFGRGIITGRSGDVGSTELFSGRLPAGAHGKGSVGADSAGSVGGAAPTGSGGAAVETGGDWLPLPPGAGVAGACACPCELELPDGMGGCAICVGEGPCMRTLGTGGYATGAVSVGDGA
jgi:hypothetical protein